MKKTQHLSSDIALPKDLHIEDISLFSASAVILNEKNEILLMLRDDYPVWVNIGGNVDDGEDFKTAALREIMEETSLEVDIKYQGKDYFSLVKYQSKKTYRHERVYLCSKKYPQNKEILGNEGVCLEWFNINNLPQNIPPRHRVRIIEVFKKIECVTSVLQLPNTEDFIKTLSVKDIYGIEIWKKNFRVLNKKNENNLKFWFEDE